MPRQMSTQPKCEGGTLQGDLEERQKKNIIAGKPHNDVP